MKRLDPDYKGFRGHGNEPIRSGRIPLESVTCAVCGRKRNVPIGIALDQGEGYICSRCLNDDGEPSVAESEARQEA